jgi:UPF0755 protein
VRRLLGTFFLLAICVAALAAWWLNQALTMNADSLDLAIEPGTSPRAVAQAVADAGVQVDPSLLYAWFRLSGQARRIKAGSYEITRPTTPRQLLSKLARGEESLRALTLIEGWNFRQVREALAKADQLRQMAPTLSDELLMQSLGRPGQNPEGRFFPDTYTYAKGSTDLALLQRAARAMDKKLGAAWALHDADSPLKSADEALILASIVEKETGQAADRAQIAGVFLNRLRIGMLLQTDPSVIYGMGAAFDGNIRKRDLQADTPYNTYTRAGLPPTPIAMPGKASLEATVRPARTKALYFVARGDGSSQFSSTLEEHNRAVNKFQRLQ